VAAVDGSGRVAAFSSRGGPATAGKPDLAAPGVDVLSAVPGGGYAQLSGTSMATPHVAGVVALMWSANPALVGNIAATTALLRSSAGPEPPTRCGTAAGSGAGLVDADAAVAAARGYAG
jgi:subtilisin family serine protease